MKGVILLFIIAKINKNKKTYGFLYKTYDNRYLFDTSLSNMYFDTQDAALNFIYYCSDYVKSNLSEGDTLIVLPYRDDKLIKIRFEEGDNND